MRTGREKSLIISFMQIQKKEMVQIRISPICGEAVTTYFEEWHNSAGANVQKANKKKSKCTSL